MIESDSREEYLSIRYSHPLWLVREFTDLLGSEEAEALLETDNGQPPITAQINTCRTTMEQTLDRLAEAGVEAQPHPWLPTVWCCPGRETWSTSPPFGRGCSISWTRLPAWLWRSRTPGRE